MAEASPAYFDLDSASAADTAAAIEYFLLEGCSVHGVASDDIAREADGMNEAVSYFDLDVAEHALAVGHDLFDLDGAQDVAPRPIARTPHRSAGHVR